MCSIPQNIGVEVKHFDKNRIDIIIDIIMSLTNPLVFHFGTIHYLLSCKWVNAECYNPNVSVYAL